MACQELKWHRQKYGQLGKVQTQKQASIIHQDYQSKGFEIPALQAILFDKPDLQVFGDSHSQSELIAHLEKVASLANALGAQVLVFGSPKKP